MMGIYLMIEEKQNIPPLKAKGYMLSELKKISQIKVDYETQGYFDSDPGDTFSLEDSVYYNPSFILKPGFMSRPSLLY